MPEYAGSQRSALDDEFDSRGSTTMSVAPRRLALDDALGVRIEVVARLEVGREQQNRPCVRVVWRRPVGAGPQKMPEPRR